MRRNPKELKREQPSGWKSPKQPTDTLALRWRGEPMSRRQRATTDSARALQIRTLRRSITEIRHACLLHGKNGPDGTELQTAKFAPLSLEVAEHLRRRQFVRGWYRQQICLN